MGPAALAGGVLNFCMLKGAACSRGRRLPGTLGLSGAAALTLDAPRTAQEGCRGLQRVLYLSIRSGYAAATPIISRMPRDSRQNCICLYPCFTNERPGSAYCVAALIDNCTVLRMHSKACRDTRGIGPTLLGARASLKLP